VITDNLLADLEPFTEDVVSRLRGEVGSYAAVPFDEHVSNVSGQIRDILIGVGSGRRPTQRSLDEAADFGWRRASQGVPLGDLMEAYHFCYREIWMALTAGRRRPETTDTELVAIVDLLWSWTQGLSSAAARAHADALRTSFAEQTDIRRRFFQALLEGDLEGAAIERLASPLEFDPRGSYQALVANERAALHPGRHQGVVHSYAIDGLLYVLLQDADVEGIATALAGKGDTPIGIGVRRAGLDGAALSLETAQLALTIAERRQAAVSFGSAWLPAIAERHREQLETLFSDGGEIAAEHPELAETIEAFAAGRFRIAECAARLHLHPNSAKYRLDRWARLTGWDPYTIDGLVSSLLAIELWAEKERGANAATNGLPRVAAESEAAAQP
jgi:PucR C-terminal helix-turn-helix domain